MPNNCLKLGRKGRWWGGKWTLPDDSILYVSHQNNGTYGVGWRWEFHPGKGCRFACVVNQGYFATETEARAQGFKWMTLQGLVTGMEARALVAESQ